MENIMKKQKNSAAPTTARAMLLRTAVTFSF
jgi:hypothetical protein